MSWGMGLEMLEVKSHEPERVPPGVWLHTPGGVSFPAAVGTCVVLLFGYGT